MANPSKSKGTGGETELLRLCEKQGLVLYRTPAGASYDLTTRPWPGPETFPPLEALATRPDQGQWLVTVRLSDFVESAWPFSQEIHIEVKRHVRFALHTTFEGKFGR
jgi:hypothetical protein